jgi:hypothetical protein
VDGAARAVTDIGQNLRWSNPALLAHSEFERVKIVFDAAPHARKCLLPIDHQNPLE